MQKKEKTLFGQYTNMNTELKKLEDSYKKKSVLYDKAYQTAATNIASCKKHDIFNKEEFKKVMKLLNFKVKLS
jgi:hypothetical protein